MRDFTLAKYEKILDVIQSQGYRIYTVKDWYSTNPQEGILIRHDVDRWKGNALKMAELEASKGIFTTYYFRVSTFDPDLVRNISKLGHEIGYHYEDLSLAHGNFEKAFLLFEKHLEEMRKCVPIRTIAMHGRPLSKFDNRELWKKRELGEFNVLCEAFLSIDYRGVYYFTDTGRSWADSSLNLRDRVENNTIANVKTSDELCSFMENKPSRIALVVHPERWNNSFYRWAVYGLFDFTVNRVKQMLKALGRHG